MGKQLEVDVANPVAAFVAGDSRIVADFLPAGRYATVMFVGPPDRLMQAGYEQVEN